MANKTKTTVVNAGFPIFSITALTFTVLKLTGQIDWSWWWVLAPLWVPLAGGILFGLGLLILYILAQMSEKE